MIQGNKSTLATVLHALVSFTRIRGAPRLFAILFWTLAPLVASAQSAIEPYVEYRKRVETAQNISPLDNGLFGEQVSLYNGSTTFSVTDIDVPGNSQLPVRLSRRFAVELQPQNNIGDYDSLLRGIGNWDIDVPYMAATYALTSSNTLRCDGSYVAVDGIFRRGEVWQGISISIPGRGATSALGMQAATPHPSGSTTYKLTTSERDAFECIAMQSGFSGQGFRMTTATGQRYYFDVGTTRTAATLEKLVPAPGGEPIPVLLQRNRFYLLASKIEDRFGNTVQFQYDASGHPIRIWANDGREILLTYTSGRLSSATSHGRTWQYQYAAIAGGLQGLVAVVQPDTSRWQYAYSDSLMPSPDPATLPPMPWCAGWPLMLDATFTLIATHPSGAIGTFNFSNHRHYRSGVHATECVQAGDPANPTYDLLVPHYFDVMSIDNKTISGPGLSQPLTWSYSYTVNPQMLWGTHTTPLPYPCTTCTASKTVTVTNPDSTKSRYTFGMRYYDNDGKQLKVETLDSVGTVVRTDTSTYMAEAAAAGQPFQGEYGSILGFISDPASARIRPVVNRTIIQDGVNFVWQANTFDSLARPKSVTKSSTITGNPTRTEETTYSDNLAKWVLGQVGKVVCTAPTTALPAGCGTTGVEMFERTYDATYAIPLVTERFNKVEQTLTWDTTSAIASGQLGTTKTVADGNNNVTILSNWKRGIPQNIQYADSTGTSALVNDNGWITAVTDENGFSTGYGYDAMGRIAAITYPNEATLNYNATTITFAPSSVAAYGLPAGHWEQLTQTGNRKKVVAFDGLWRPVMTFQQDAGSPQSTMSAVTQSYDSDNRVVYQSYPFNPNVSGWGTQPGTTTTYDSLGRVKQAKQNSELGDLTTTTEYLTGFQVRTTNPRGYQTTNGYLVYDQPGYEQLAWSAQPENKDVTITRNNFGLPLSITQTDHGNSAVSVTRSYVYNPNMELCKTIEPEVGSTVMSYDAAGNLAWSAAGGVYPSTANCNTTEAYSAGRRVDRSYDTRNRLSTLSFPDGVGNQSWQYTPDGLPSQITTYNSAGNGTPVVSTYTYNHRRLLGGESSSQPGWYSWSLGYGYDANGNLSTQLYPNGLTVSYSPNALGQATSVASTAGKVYATGVRYYPNGGIQQFTYGNGIVHTMTQNSRQLPSSSVDGGIINYGFTYDANGNPTKIADNQRGLTYDRSMTYDGLDRLTGAGSGMFGGTDNWHRFTYNALDNITSWKLAGVKDYANYIYDASNRLTNIQNSAGASVVALAYDLQGNLQNKNGQAYSFDYGNRLRGAANQEAYRYDGQGRRVLQWSPTSGNIISMYSNAGQLMYMSDERRSQTLLYIYLSGSQVARVRY